MIRYFFGDDTISARGRISDIAKQERAHIRWVDKEDIGESSLQSVLDAASGSLFGKTIVVLRDVSTFPEDVRTALLELIQENRVRGHVIIWERSIPDARLTFTKKMKALEGSEGFLQPKDEREMTSWATAYVKKGGGTLSPGVIAEIVRTVGCDVHAVASEVEKCKALPSVSGEDVANIVVQRSEQETSAFPLLGAIVSKRSGDAVRLVGELITAGSSERFILSMLAYQFRLFLAARIGKEKNADASIIHQATGFHPVAIQKAMPHVSRMSLAAIMDALVRIQATEKALTTSSMDPRSMVTMLVVSLSK